MLDEFWLNYVQNILYIGPQEFILYASYEIVYITIPTCNNAF